MQVWECKIGVTGDVALPPGADYPMRQAVAKAFKAITGQEDDFLFSGWNAALTESELAVVEDRLPDEPYDRAYAPHCDPSILHKPGRCRFCDLYPDWQAYRETARVNFTGESDGEKAPCPSLAFRSGETRDRWPGNRAAPGSE